MRSNSKYEWLYQELYLRISNGFYSPGSLLPREVDFAVEFGVTRKTLRKALDILEEKNMIQRHRSRGTFVAEQENWSKPTITLLLPCEFYREVAAFPAYFNAMLVDGTLAGCQMKNCSFETIAISSFNDLEHINRYRLNHLDRTSRVIVPSCWYQPLFPFLVESGCRVFYIAVGRLQSRGQIGIPENWQTAMLDDFTVMTNAVDYLSERNCRKIALASCWINNADNALIDGYRTGLDKAGQAERLVLSIPGLNQEPMWPYLRERLIAWHRQTGFDGLILCPDENDLPPEEYFTNEALGLPETVKIVMANRCSARQLHSTRIPVFYYDLKRLAARAVEALLEREYLPSDETVPPVLLNPSTPKAPKSRLRIEMV